MGKELFRENTKGKKETRAGRDCEVGVFGGWGADKVTAKAKGRRMRQERQGSGQSPARLNGRLAGGGP